MDWQKVIDGLNEQAGFYSEKANQASWMAGSIAERTRWQTNADIASILASALTRGIAAPDQS